MTGRDVYPRLLDLAHTEEIEAMLEEGLALAGPSRAGPGRSVRAPRAERGRVRVFRAEGDDDDRSLVHADGAKIPTRDSRSIEAEAR